MVEEVFVRTAPVLDLHVGGRTITTTAEHPFFAEGRGWVPARELERGCRMPRAGSGRRVAAGRGGGLQRPDHDRLQLPGCGLAYVFVGSDEWGFSVWAHNACVYQSVENGNVVYIGIADTGTLPSLAIA